MKTGDILKVINDKPFPVNDKGPKIKIDETYVLLQIHTCNCGEQHFHIGLAMELNYVQCYKCREDLPLTNHWCHSSRFEPTN